MASLTRIPTGKWRARYVDNDGRQRARHFDRKADAERFLSTIQADLIRGTYVDPSRSRQRFGEYAEQWRQIQIHRPATASKVANDLRKHILPFFGHRAIGSIRTSEVQGWVKQLSESLSPKTIESIYRELAAIFISAVNDQVIPASPCRGIRLPPQKSAAHLVPMTTEEVQAIVAAAPERHRALILTAAGTGLRRGEVLGLTVDRLDFLRRTLRVDRQLAEKNGTHFAFGPPKTRASLRTVPLPDPVLEALARHLERFASDRTDFVFTQSDGFPLSKSTLWSMWHATMQKAGIKRRRFHELRHYYTSLLIAHGASVKVVQARLGHATAVETLDTYGHLWPDSDDVTRAAVAAAWGAESPSRVVPDASVREMSVVSLVADAGAG